MYGNNFYSNTMESTFTGSAVWTIIAFILAIVGGFLAYYLFVKNTKKMDNKFLNWLKRFLDFKEMLIEPILKVSYVILAIFITLYSFNMIGVSFIAFLLTLVLGNIVLRIIYEWCLVLIMIWKNTTEINDKTKK
jgi:hypothetical protein